MELGAGLPERLSDGMARGRGGAEASGDEAGEAGRGQIVQDFYAMSRNLHFLQRELGTRRRVESRTVTAQTWVFRSSLGQGCGTHRRGEVRGWGSSFRCGMMKLNREKPELEGRGQRSRGGGGSWSAVEEERATLGSGWPSERRQGLRAHAWAWVRALCGAEGLRMASQVRSFEAKQRPGDLDSTGGCHILVCSVGTWNLPWAKSIQHSKIKTICKM